MEGRYQSPTVGELKQTTDLFSVFPPGHVNGSGQAVVATTPMANTTIEKVYQFVVSEQWAGKATKELRTIADHGENSRYKMLNFFVATFSCVVTYRKADNVVAESPYQVFDFDKEDVLKAYPDTKIEDAIDDLRAKLLADKNITTVLLFVSPNGNGLKWVVNVGDRQGLTHREAFDAISEYVLQRYKVKVDASGSDICRACFLPHDPNCYVHPDLKNMKASAIDLRVWQNERKGKRAKVAKSVGTPFTGNTFDDVYGLVESWVSRDVTYAPGSYNRYVSKCGYLLCEFGVAEAEATEWAISRFFDYRPSDLISIFRSCYRNGCFGKRNFIQKNNKK